MIRGLGKRLQNVGNETPGNTQRPRWRRLLAATLSIAILGGGLAAFTGAAPAEAAPFTKTFEVNDVRMLVDASPGDGTCSTGASFANTCTLYAAIQESNAFNAANTTATVLITPAASIRQANGTMASTGNVMLQQSGAPAAPDGTTAAQNNPNNVGPMVTNMNSVAGGSSTAESNTWFRINDRTTIDFQNRLGTFATTAFSPQANAFVLIGQSNSMRNFAKLTSNSTSIYVGAAARNSVIQNGTLQNATGALLQHGVVIIGGAQNTTISKVVFGSIVEQHVGFVPNNSNSNLAATGILIDRSDFNNDAYISGAATSANKPTGIGGTVGDLPVSNLSVTNNTFRDFGWGVASDAGTAISAAFIEPDNMVVQGNVFSRRAGTIPGSLGNAQQIYVDNFGTMTIRRNAFVWNSTTTQPGDAAIWINHTGFPTPGIVIADNTFNNWNTNDGLGGDRVIQLGQQTSATISAYRNTMVNSSGATAAANENSNNDNPLYNASSNNNMRTSFPGLLPAPPVIGAGCTANLVLSDPASGSGGTASTSYPMQVDVFASPTGGDGKGMTQYLGRVQINSAAGWGQSYSVPYTGGPGLVRVQTMDATGRSSQYSRTVALTGIDICGPQTWIKQADGQEDPTSFRNVTYSVQSSEPLGTNGLTAADISFAGSTAPNPSVVSVTQTSSTTWTVVAKANGSGTIVPSIPSGSVNDPAGNSQTQPSNSTTTPLNFATLAGNPNLGLPGPSVDNSVTYTSPLSLSPTSVTVTEGGATATYDVNTSKPTTADVTITPTAPAGLVTVTPSPLVLRTTDSAVTATVTAVDNAITDGTRTGSVTHTVTSTDPEFDGLMLGSVGVTVNDNDAPVAANSTFAVSSGTQLANGVATHTATATVRNGANQVVQGATVTFTLPAGVTANGVTGPGTTTATTNASGVAAITITSQAPGTYSISANLSGTQIGTAQNIVFTAVPISPGNSTLVTSTGTRAADGVAQHTATLTARDASGNPVANTQVFFSVGGGATGTGTATTDLNGQATISITSTTIGSKTVTVYAGSDTSGTQIGTGSVSFVAGAPVAANSSLTVSSGNKIANGSDQHTATVTVKDASGNVVPGATVNFSIPAGVTASATSAVTDASGVATITLTSTLANTYSIGASVGGSPVSASPKSVTFVAGPASAANSTLVLSGGNQVANGTAAHTATVTTRDANGNIVAGAAVTFTVGGGATGSGTVVSNASGVATISITSTTSGSKAVSATIGGIAVPGSGSVTFVAGAASAANSDLTVTAGSVPADGTSTHTATVVVKDAQGNLVSGATVTFAVGAGATASAPSAVSDASGVATVTITSTVSGSYSVAATIAGTAVNGSPKSVTFAAGAADAAHSSWVVTPAGPVTADGTAAYTGTFTARDVNDNLVQGAVFTVTVPGDVNASAANCTANASGICAIDFTSTTAGTYSVTAALGSTQVGSAEDLEFVAGAASASDSDLSVTAGGRVADGADSHTATVVVRDANGNPVAGATIDFDVMGATANASSVVTGVSGIASVTITSTTPGAKTVTASIDGADVAGSPATVSFVVGAPDATESSLTVTTTPALANNSDAQTATVMVKDAQGNLVPGATVGFTVASGATLSAASAVSDLNGVATVTITSGAPGSYDVHATLGGTDVTGSPAPAAFVAGAFDADASSLTATTGNRVADGADTHTVTATVTDAQGHPLAGVTVDFTAQNGATLADASVVTDGDGVASTTVTSTTAGRFDVSATVGGVLISDSPVTLAFVAGPASAADSDFSVTAGDVLADGSAEHRATVVVRDANGNPVAGATVDFDVPAGVDASAASVISDVNGVAQISLTSTTAGTYSIGASIGGTVVAGAPKDVTFSAGAASAANSSWTVTPAGPVTADGTATYTATVTARDSNDNPVEDAVISFTVPGGVDASDVTCTTDASGACSVTFTSTVAGSYTVSAAIGGNQIGSDEELVFVAGAASLSESTVSAAPATIPADGSTQSTVTVSVRDANGNILRQGGSNVVIQATAGTISGTTDNGDGTYTATLTGTSPATADISFTIGGAAADAMTTVTLTDATAPDAPVVDPSNGSVVTGIAEPGSTVTIRDEDGTVIGTGIAAPDGSFSIVPSPVPGDGDEITVTATDEQGNTSPGTTITIDASAPAAPIVDPTNGSVVTGTAEPGSTVTIRDEDGTVIGSGPAAADGSFSIVPSPRPLDGDVITVTATDVAGNTSPGTDVTVDASAPAAPVVDPTNGQVVTGTAEPGSTVTIRDEDGNVIGTGTVAADGSFSINPSPVPGDGDVLTLTATDAAGNTSPEAQVTVDAGIPDAPVVDPTNGQVVTGTAEPGSTVTIRDEDGNVIGTGPAAADGSFSINPSPVPADGDVLSVTATDAAGNTSPATSVTVDAGIPAAPVVDPSDGSVITGIAEPGLTVTIRDDDGNIIGTGTAGPDGSFSIVPSPTPVFGDDVTVTATDESGNTSPGTTITIGAGPVSAAHSTLILSGGDKVADGSDAHTATVTTRDANGNIVAGAAVTFTVGGGATGAGTVVSDASGVATITITSTTSGSKAVSATIGGIAVPGAGSVNFVAGTPSAADSDLTVTTGDVPADGTSTHTASVVVRDAQGNLVSGATVDFAVGAGADASALSAVTNASGVATITITSDEAGSFSVAATIAGTAVNGSPASVTFTSGAASAANSSWVVTPAGPVAADGTTAYTGTFTARDVNDNLVEGAVFTVTVPGAVTASSATCTTDASGVCTIDFTSTTAGTYSVTAALGSTQVGVAKDLVFVAGAASAADSTLSVTTGGRVADGADSHTATVVVRDSNGNTVAGATVDFAVPGATGSAGSVVSGADGVAQITITATTPGDKTVTATIGGTEVAGSPKTVSFVVGAPSATESSLTVTTAPTLANNSDAQTATVVVKDAQGNLVPNATVDFSVAAGATLSAASATSDANGVARVTIISATPGSYDVHATLSGADVTGSPAPATFIAGPVDASTSTFTVTSGNKIADGTDTHTLTATAKDAQGHPLAGVTIDFDAESGAALTAPSAVTDVNGVASTTVTSTTAGTYAMSASVGGAPISGSPADVTFVAGAASAADSTFDVTAGVVLADGSAEHAATVTVMDANGNPVEGATVDFDVPAGVDASAASAVSDANGVASITLTSTTAGTYPIGASIDGTDVAGAPKDVEFGAGAASAANSSWTVTPAGPVTADGSSAYTATVVARDANDNPVEDAVISFTVPAGVDASDLTCTTDASGECSVTFTSTNAGSYTVSAALGANQIGSDEGLVFVAGAASLSESTVSASPTMIPADGTTSSTVTVTVKDANGNVLTTGGGNVVISTSTGTISGTTDNGDGTYTATLTGTTPGLAELSFTIGGADAGAVALVTLTDATAPAAPVVDPSNGSVVTGTAEPGSTVTVADSDGNPIGTGTAGPDGSFSIVPSPVPGDGDEITVTATDDQGNTSPGTTITIDASAPAAPVVDPTNGSVVTGIAEPGSTVTIRDEDGIVIGSGPAAADGSFSIVPSPRPLDGDVITVTATDVAGNTSPGTDVTVDASAPAAPVVDPSNGSSVTGIAEPGSTITVKDDGGNTIGTGTAGPDGTFTITPSPVPGHGDEVTVTATDDAGNTSPGTTITIDAVAPDAPVVDPTNGTTVTGTAEPGSTVTITDSNGNPIGTGTAGPDGSFSIDPSPVPGDGDVITVTATDPAGNTSPGTDVTVDSSAPAAPVLDPSDGSVITGTAEPGSTVTIRDEDGNVIGTGTAAADGSFSIVPSPTPVFGDDVTATATDEAGNTSPGTTITIGAGPVSAADSTLVLSGGNRIADGADAHTATVTARDANGNPVADTAVTFTVGGGASGSGTVVTDANGVATITITSTTSGSKAVSATIGGIAVPGAGSVAFVAGAASANDSDLTVTAGDVPADGTSTHTATVVVRDAQGNLVSGATVDFAIGAGADASASSAVSDASGVATITITSTVAGDFSVAATIGGAAVDGSPASVSFSTGAASAANSSWSVSAGPVVADGTSTYTGTFTARDVNDNLVEGAVFTVTVPGAVTASAETCTTDASGECTIDFTSTTAGTYSVTAALGSTQVGSAEALVFIAGSVDPAASDLTVTTGGRVADGSDSHTSTVVVRDSNGNPVAGATVDFAVPGATESAASVVSGADGVAQITITSTTAGDKTVTATIGGTEVAGSPATVTFVVGAPSATESALTVTTDPALANNSDAQTATVVVKDAQGNLVPGATVDFTVAAGATLSAASATSDANGVATVTITSGTPGSYDVHATLGGTDVTGSPAPAAFIAGPFDASTSTLVATPGNRIADGVDTHTVTATITDAQGHPLAGVTVDFATAVAVAAVAAGAADLASASVVTDANGVASTTVTSTTAGTYAVSASVSDVEISGSPADVTFVAGPASAADSDLTVTAGPVPADGTSTHSASVVVRDAQGNLVSGATVDFAVGAGADASASSAVSDASGVATITITSTVSGDFSVAASIGGVDVNGSPASVTFATGAADAAHSSWSASAGPVTADGVDSYTGTFTARDANDNLVEGAVFTVTVPGAVTASSATCTTDASGVCTIDFTSTTAGTYSVTAALGATQVGVAEDLEFIAGAASLSESTVVAAPATIPADGATQSTITVTVRDATGNILTQGGSNVVIQTSTGTISGTVDNGDGTYTATLTGTVPATADISFTIGGAAADATTSVTLTDATAPAAPVVDPSNGSVVTGTAEPGSTVTVADSDGNPIGTGTAGPDGSFSIVPSPVPGDGDEITVTATDDQGNTSPGTTITIDASAPAAPIVDPTNGSVVTGTAEPGSTVTITDSTGAVIGSGPAAADGSFSIVPSPRPLDGDVITVTATDVAGNTSPGTTVTVDASPPAAPLVDPTDGTNVTGTAEPGSTITVKDDEGNELCSTTVRPDGTFSCIPSNPPAPGTTITVTATDPAGNVSPETTITVDEPTDVVTPPTTTPTPPAKAPGAAGHWHLPFTGADVVGIALLGVILLAVGLFFLLWKRRRREEEETV